MPFHITQRAAIGAARVSFDVMLRNSIALRLGLVASLLAGCHASKEEKEGNSRGGETARRSPHPLTDQDIRSLPETMTVEQLFGELWAVDFGDPPILFYPSTVEDHSYAACPHPDDGGALAEGDFANVRVRSIFLFRGTYPTKLYEPALWGESSFEEPIFGARNPFHDETGTPEE